MICEECELDEQDCICDNMNKCIKDNEQWTQGSK
jgi:hypothetical protein